MIFRIRSFYFTVQVNCQESRAERTGPSLPNIIPNYTIHLYPPLVLHNLLPYDLQFVLEESTSPNELIHGESKAIYSLDVNESPKVVFQVRYNCSWNSTFIITPGMHFLILCKIKNTFCGFRMQIYLKCIQNKMKPFLRERRNQLKGRPGMSLFDSF